MNRQGMGRSILFAIVVSAFANSALAHKLAPALLEVEEGDSHRYTVTWTAAIGELATALPQLPNACEQSGWSNASLTETGTAIVRRQRMHCANGLAGEHITIPERPSGQSAVLTRFVPLDGAPKERLLTRDEKRYTPPLTAASGSVIGQYLQLGVKHILIGLDHLLFVAALLLLADKPRTLIRTVTAFTAGHSLTLAMVVLNIIPQWPDLIEFAIAITILILALELAGSMFNSDQGGKLSIFKRRQWPIAAVFGMVHGLGFASVLTELGLPKEGLVTALAAFNIGIEIGQLVFVASLAAVLISLKRRYAAAHRPAVATLIYIMGGVSVYWCVERGLSLLHAVI